MGERPKVPQLLFVETFFTNPPIIDSQDHNEHDCGDNDDEMLKETRILTWKLKKMLILFLRIADDAAAIFTVGWLG